MAADSEVSPTAGEASNTVENVPGDAPVPATGGVADQKQEKPGHNGAGNRKRAGEKGRAEWSRQRTEKHKRDRRERGGVWRDAKRQRLNMNDDTETNVSINPFSKEEIAAEERRPKRKVAVMIGYSGTGYKGMQVNGDEPTIERDLFRAFIDAKAISKANADDPKKVSLVRCARTDKGVHAAGNVISLKLITEDEDIVEKINEKLPEQIRIWGIERTSNSFSCYHACDSRWYEYLMPSYCLLPPHPQSFLGKQVRDRARGEGKEEELDANMEDVKGFWEEVEEKEIKPLLARLDPELRNEVMQRIHSIDVLEPKSDAAAADTNKSTASGENTEEVVADEGKAAGAEAATPAGDTVNIQHDSKKSDSSTDGTLNSVQPKNRDLTALDYALRDIKNVYIRAQRRYRITPTRLQRLQSALDKYVGTINFHNYTVQKPFNDPSAKRHIKSFVVNPEPITIRDTEWLSLKVHGQSFMMHQIRKMVGMASIVVRCGTPLERMDESFEKQKIAIPKAPGLGLLLERPVFDAYNKKAVEVLEKKAIDFRNYEKKIQEFKDKFIYQRIFEIEEEENSFYSFFSQIDQFKTNHFLWATAGGVKAAELTKLAANEQVVVDKELGDEDEDPNGGEG